MNILLTNGTDTTTTRATAYSRSDVRIPAALAKAALARLGSITGAYLDGEPVTVTRRADGALAVG